jgi:hypothetical protein
MIMAHLDKYNISQITKASFFEQFSQVPAPTKASDPLDIFFMTNEKCEEVVNLCQDRGDLLAYYKGLLEQYKPVRMRKDLVTCCRWHFEPPKEAADPEKIKNYFIVAFVYCTNLYSIDNDANILGCWFHKGAKQSMDFVFVPVFEDDTGKHIRFSELITRRHLFDFHPKFYDFLRSQGIVLQSDQQKEVQHETA